MSKYGFSSDGLTSYSILSTQAIDEIHASTLEVLENTGVRIMHERGCKLLETASCVVDWKTHVVKLPASLVEQCLTTTPGSFIMAGREPDRDLEVGANGKVFCRNGGGPGHVQDLDTGTVRDASLLDVRDYARLVDAMDTIHIAAPIYAQDVAPAVRDLTGLATLFASTTKHINMRLLQLSSLPYVLQMAEIVAGSRENLHARPVITLLESPIAPLGIPDVLVETLLACGNYGIPVEICSMPIAGATGPITLAGSLLMSNVEMIAAIVISQLANPGARLVFTPRIMIMDMKTGHALTGSVENALLAAAGAQLGREKYHIPVNVHGPYTDSKISDAGAGFENTYFTLLPALVGANILTGAGHLEGGLFVSYTQLMIDGEINGAVQRVLQGFEVNQVSLGVEAIHRSLSHNNLLIDEHTIENLRKTNFYKPKLVNRTSRQIWEEQGALSMGDRAHAMAKKILTSHEPAPLEQDIQKELKKVLEQAARDLSP